jgi:hypothetical protein
MKPELQERKYAMNIDNAEIINPLGSGIDCHDGNVVVATTGGSMWGGGNTCSNLIVFPELHTEATVEMTLDLLPQCGGEQAGIVLYIDNDNYVKFIREMVGEDQVVVLAKEIEGKPNPELITPFEPSGTSLQLTVNGDGIGIRWGSSDADDFQTGDYPDWFAPGTEFRVGLLVHGNNPGNQAVFHSMSINGESR